VMALTEQPLPYLTGAFLVQVQVGTPPQTIQVLLDTASADFNILGLSPNDEFDCTESGTSKVQKCFDYRRSKSWVALGSNQTSGYLSGDIHGQVGWDTVKFGPIRVKRQAIAVAYSSTMNLQFGVAGISFSALSQLFPVRRTLLQHMGQDRPLQRAAISFFYAAFTEYESQVALGEPNSSLYQAPIIWSSLHQVNTAKYWELPMSGLFIDGKYKFCRSKCTVVMDTGSTRILGPAVFVRAIRSIIQSKSKRLHRNCSNAHLLLPTLSFGIGNYRYDLEPRFYMRNDAHLHKCRCVLKACPLSKDGVQRWNLGVPFMRKFHTTFDYDRRQVGFALSINADNHQIRGIYDKHGRDVTEEDDSDDSDDDDADDALEVASDPKQTVMLPLTFMEGPSEIFQGTSTTRRRAI